MPKLTATPLLPQTIRELKPGPVAMDYRDGLARGLILRVLPSGKKFWTLRYLFRGKHRRHVLGEFPTITLAQARDLARDTRTEIRDSRDPAGEAAAAKAIPTGTVRALADAYVEGHAIPRKKTGAEDKRILEVDVLPYIGDIAVRDLTRRDCRAVIERVMNRGAGYAANRTLEIVRRMLNWGVRRDWLDANPAAMIEKPGIEKARERVLTDDELRALWSLLERFPERHEKRAPGRTRASVNAQGQRFCPISPALAAVTKFRLLSAQRGGEVVRMKWADLNLGAGWWTIPAEDSKNGRPHRVPVTPEMVALINAQPKKKSDAVYVFEGHAGARVDERVKKAGAALSRVLGFEFRSHDLRRTAATRMAALGVPRDHISHVLNHTAAGAVATRVYDRYTYDSEKRAALTRWNLELVRLLTDAPAPKAEIVPIRGRRRRA